MLPLPHFFQVLDCHISKEKGFKDTISLNPAESVRLIMQIPNYSDPNTSYIYHCHNLEHEDMEMMEQFVVVDKDSIDEEIHIKSNLRNNTTEMQMH